MSTREKIGFCLSLTAFLVMSCVTSSVFEKDKKALVQCSNVVYGTVLEKIDLYDTYTPYYTKYVFHVKETIKGQTHSDTISLLSRSGLSPDGLSRVYVTFEHGFKVGDNVILIMSPLKRPTSSLHVALQNTFGGIPKADYSIKDQYRVQERVVFENGKSRFIDPAISPQKMIKLMKDYLKDQHKRGSDAEQRSE
ncbi:MAG: hypothetical protein AAGA77_12800 [Bacteroidota bacterium]